MYDPVSEGEATTITEVIAGSDVKEKDNAVIVATESDTHIKIIGYNCGYYYDCDYGYEYDTRDENMEIKSGTRLTPASYLSPCKALLRAGDFVFTGQPPGGYNASGGHDYNFDHNFEISDMASPRVLDSNQLGLPHDFSAERNQPWWPGPPAGGCERRGESANDVG